MAVESRPKESAPVDLGPLLAALPPLSEIVSAILPNSRLTVVSIVGDTLEIVASSGAVPCPVGASLKSPLMRELRTKLDVGGAFVAAVGDIEVPENLREPLRRLGFQRGLVAPLHTFGDVLHCAVIDRSGGALALGDAERHVLAAAIDQTRRGFENDDLRLQAAQGQKTLETIVHLGVALSSVLDLKVIADQVVEYAGLLFRLPAVALLSRSEGMADFTLLASEGLPKSLSRLHVEPIELAGLEARWPADVAESPPGSLFEALQRRRLTNTFVAPLEVGGRYRAVLLGLDRPERQPTDEERNAFDLVALQASTAMRNAKLLAEVVDAQALAERQLAHTTLLRDATAAATSSLSLAGVAQRVLGAIAERVGLQIGTVYLYDASTRQLTLLASWGLDDAYLEQVRTFAVDEGSPALVSKAVLERQIVSSEDVRMTEARREMLQRAGLGVTQNVAVPLETSEGVVGTCSFVIERHEPFAQDELALFSSLGRILSQAIENARLLGQTQEAARLSDALNAANKAIHSTLDIDQVMQHALETGAAALSCDAATIEMLEGEEWVVRHQEGFSARAVGARLSRDQAPNVTLAAKRRVPIAVDDMRAGQDPVFLRFAKRQESMSALIVPLIAKGVVIGCALFYASPAMRHFTEAEVDFGRKLGSAVSLGLENARLYASEHGIAETLQQALLSLPDRLPGVEFAPFYRSATELTRVGGDFYYIFEQGDRCVGITIGDISGKGLGAAVLTSLVKNTIRAHANEGTKTPGQVLALTNEIMHRSTATEVFATVFFGILDLRDGHLRYANAGHTTGAVLKRDGTILKLPASAPIVGAFSQVVFDESEACLDWDEFLFLYTDGLTEAWQDSDLYGEERLFELLSASKRGSAQDIVAEAMADVMQFAGNRLRDDLAVLAVRRVEGHGRPAGLSEPDGDGNVLG